MRHGGECLGVDRRLVQIRQKVSVASRGQLVWRCRLPACVLSLQHHSGQDLRSLWISLRPVALCSMSVRSSTLCPSDTIHMELLMWAGEIAHGRAKVRVAPPVRQYGPLRRGTRFREPLRLLVIHPTFGTVSDTSTLLSRPQFRKRIPKQKRESQLMRQ